MTSVKPTLARPTTAPGNPAENAQLSDIEVDLLTRIVKHGSNPQLRNLAGRLVQDGGLTEQNMRFGIKIAVGPNSVSTAFAYLRSNTEDPELRALLRYYETTKKEPDLARLLLLLLSRAAHPEDLLATAADTSGIDDPRFAAAYEAGAAISGWDQSIRWRMYTLTACARRAASLAGDFVECGSNRGGSARCIIDFLGAEAFFGRDFYLYDTFRGVEESQLNAAEQVEAARFAGQYPPVLEQARANFATEKFVRLVPGVIPETLPEFTGGAVAFLHIDMNVALPEVCAFDYFWPKLSPGAPVVFDDYGFPFAAEQRKALDEKARQFGTKIIALPTGQGLLWR